LAGGLEGRAQQIVCDVIGWVHLRSANEIVERLDGLLVFEKGLAQQFIG
jgi:hypothetical protein